MDVSVSSIQFSLFAPYNSEAILIGDFSDWRDISMQKGEDGFFRTEVDLQDGAYQYKFRVRSQSWFFHPDAWVEVVDPYATDINDANQTGILRVKDGEAIVDTYVWQHDDVPLPADHQLVIYELHVGDFSGGEPDPDPRGKFEHVIEKLDYLVELGVNAIELMPLKEYPGDQSWGYNPRYFFAPESSYGSTCDLKRMIDECHGRGMRIIMDAVFNHAEEETPLAQIDHDYWFYHDPQDPDNYWGPEFDYEHYDENLDTYPARWFASDRVKFWIQEYHIDGIRYDAAKQIGNYDFMHWIVNETKTIAGPKPFINIAEHIPETAKITNSDGPMDSCWHTSFYHTLLDLLCQGKYDAERLKDVLDPKRQGFMGSANVVNYLSNHDHNRLMVKLGEQKVFGRAAFRRISLGMVLMMTGVGIPMIWMGEEFGEYKPKTIDSAKIDWSLLDNDENQSLLDFVRGLTTLRKQTHALYTNNIDFFHDDSEAKVLAYVRWNTEGSQVAVLANCSAHYLADYTVKNFPQGGTWHEWTHDYDINVDGTELTLDLPEYEAKVLVW
jgi:1,4-alpha-glucan branching enzyme